MDYKYFTKSGRGLTDADIEKLAAEAEAGYSWENINGRDIMVPNEPAVLTPPMSKRPIVRRPSDGCGGMGGDFH